MILLIFPLVCLLDCCIECQTALRLGLFGSQFGSLGWGDPLEEGMAFYSSVLAWRIPMDRGAWWAAVHGVAKSWT